MTMQNRSSFHLAIGVRWYRGYQGYCNFAGILRRCWQFVAFCRSPTAVSTLGTAGTTSGAI